MAFHRESKTIEEIIELVKLHKKYIENGEPFHSLFGSNILPSKRAWKRSITSKLDTSSARELFFQKYIIDFGYPVCVNCKKVLSQDEYRISNRRENKQLICFGCVKSGGNRYCRKEKTKEEIEQLFEKIKNNNTLGYKTKSLFSNKIFKNEKLWINDVVRHLDRTALKELVYKYYCYFNPIPRCAACNTPLSSNNLIFPTLLKFENNCNNCIEKNKYPNNRRSHVYSEEERQKKSKNLSKGLKAFYATPKGKENAKRIGQINSEKMQEFSKTTHGKEIIRRTAARNSETMKRKIANGEFSPCITNSRTHWTAVSILNGVIKKFRSSWEACFYISNPNLEYETVRIPYFNHITQDVRTYIADFFDRVNNTIYEIKPKRNWGNNQDKMDQIITFCREGKINFIWINEQNITDYVNEKDFDNNNIKQYNMLMQGIKGAKTTN